MIYYRIRIYIFGFVLVFLCCLVTSVSCQHPGHLKPFGHAGPFEPIEEIDGFPNSRNFFMNYVLCMKPLKIKKGCRTSPAFSLWSDVYLSSITSLQNETVMVEIGKIEDRNKPVVDMPFLEFLKTYNDSNKYLVSSVPNILSSDILLPLPLQCPQIYLDHLLVNVMWMSSGGTASVVHVDSVDNIICLFRGTKQFILIDPMKYSQQVLMEHPDEGYSDIDVLKVNYTKYFGLVNISYHAVNLSAGDCLFVPYRWIHQVTSFNSNIAVNIWWDHLKNQLINLNECVMKINPYISLKEAIFHGIQSSKIDDFKTELRRYLKRNVDLDNFMAVFLSKEETLDGILPNDFHQLKQMFLLIDANGDGVISLEEIDNTSIKDWTQVESHFMEYEKIRSSKKLRTSSDVINNEL